MAESSSIKINQENDIENKINFIRFGIVLLYILIIDKISSLKSLILGKEETVLFFQRKIQGKELHCLENGFFEVKNKSIMNLIKRKYKKINNKAKEIQTKKEKIV